MILKVVEIQGVRCFSQPIRVDLAKDGFTIIYGPNGSGKSTLLAAAMHGLLDVHTSAGAETFLRGQPAVRSGSRLSSNTEVRITGSPSSSSANEWRGSNAKTAAHGWSLTRAGRLTMLSAR